MMRHRERNQWAQSVFWLTIKENGLLYFEMLLNLHQLELLNTEL